MGGFGFGGLFWVFYGLGTAAAKEEYNCQMPVRPHWPSEAAGALQSQGWQCGSCCEGFVNAVLNCHWARQEINIYMFTVVFFTTSD